MPHTPSAASQIVMIPVGKLRPNRYNPNRLTLEQFQENVAEVRRLGRPAKPIVVRRVADEYEIIDGEHGWQPPRRSASPRSRARSSKRASSRPACKPTSVTGTGPTIPSRSARCFKRCRTWKTCRFGSWQGELMSPSPRHDII